MSLLQRKLWRDLCRLWSQVLTIALVVASAVGALVTTQACVHSLEAARDRFYREAQMADVFASLRRAPRSVLPVLEALDGVQMVQATVERPARLMLPGVVSPIMGHVVGVPREQPLRLNQVWLRTPTRSSAVSMEHTATPGRWPGAPTGHGILPAWLSEGFAQARGLEVGDQLQVLMNGRLRAVEVVALALAPDVVFAGALGMPDPAGYGVLWVDEGALAAAWDMEGAFNRLAFRLSPGAREPAVLASINERLPMWGGREALPRRLQGSHQMLDNEIQEQRLLGSVLPTVFALASVFLLHIVMTRLVATQRESMAALKALGFDNRTLALHHLQMGLVIGLIGWLVGMALGAVAAQALLNVYADFFRFPRLDLVLPGSVALLGAVLAAAAVLMGTAQALVGILRQTPAQAMQPAAPAPYRPSRWAQALERGLAASLVMRMILRQWRRRPWRNAASVLGLASAMALVVMGHFFRDAIDHIVSHQFNAVWRGDVQVMTLEPVSSGAIRELRRLNGQSLEVEGSRQLPATLVHGHRQRRVQLRGIEPNALQQRVLDMDGRALQVTDEGLILTDRLADQLGVQRGDAVLLHLPESPRPWASLVVMQLVSETMGLSATTSRATLNRLMGEAERFNLFSMRVPEPVLDPVLQTLSGLPAVGGAFSKAHLLRNMQAITARNIRIMSGIMTGFALVLAVGVVYNLARIALAERAWELASLRVLGFTRAEVARLLVGEQLLMLVLALPLGMGLGWLLVWGLSVGLRSDQFQFPVVIWPRTYALAGLSVVAAALWSAWIVWRRVRTLDLVAALKTRE